MQMPFMPPQASTVAARSDAVTLVITLVGLVFALGVAITIAWFAVKYRKGNRVNRVLPGHEGVALELTWTIIPLIIAIGLFVWSTSVYFSIARVPNNAMEVYVVGKQWMWKLQQPNGRWEMNELHVPLGRAVKLTMISEDVIHDFFIPAFRVKMDVVPGRYTQLWFQPTQTGRFHIFCSQYCGTNHAIMGGYVHVMKPADYQKWLEQGNVDKTVASNGERLFRSLGCTGCHGANSSVRAPSLVGLYNQNRPIQIPGGGNRVVKADYRYLHDAIILPEKEIAAGYQPIMPSYKGRVSEEEVLQLVDYIKTMGTSNGTSNGSARNYAVNSAASTGGLSKVSPVVPKAGDAANVTGTTTQGTLRGNPTGDMADINDREAIYKGGADGEKPRVGRRNPTGDMTDIIDREAIYRGGGTGVGDGDTLDDSSAGGKRAEAYTRPGLNPYTTQNYAKSKARVQSGLQPGSGITPPIRGRVNSDNITRFDTTVQPGMSATGANSGNNRNTTSSTRSDATGVAGASQSNNRNAASSSANRNTVVGSATGRTN